MNTVMICLATAITMPIFLSFASVRYRLSQFGRVDISTPRLQAEKLDAGGHRVAAAQSNAWEALAMYIGALLMTTMAGLSLETITTASLVFIAARIAHAIFYIADKSILRTFSFAVGFGSVIWIIVKAFNA